MRKAFVLVPLVLAIATLALPGEASATPITYKATLDGPSEGTASPGVGSATVIVDDIANLMFVSADFAGLLGNTTAAHIHCCTAVPGAGTAGVATTTPSFPGFPLGVTSGNMDQTFDLLLPAATTRRSSRRRAGSPKRAPRSWLVWRATRPTSTSTLPCSLVERFAASWPLSPSLFPSRPASRCSVSVSVSSAPWRAAVAAGFRSTLPRSDDARRDFGPALRVSGRFPALTGEY